ncbi:MAG: DUF6428 family protein [Pseudomonadota bacterium]
MNLSDLAQGLAAQDPALPLIFETEDGSIKGGYHVTEFRVADVAAIDCGGNTAQRKEAYLQLLDGGLGGHMPVGTFLKIVEQSIRHLPDLADTPLRAEFSHGNIALRLFDIGNPTAEDDAIRLPLTDQRAECGPAMRGECGPKSRCC